MVNSYYNPQTRGATEFGGVSSGFSQIAENRASGDRRRYEQDLFEQALLASVEGARADAATKATTRAAGRDDLDLYKFKYQMYNDDRQYAMDREMHGVDMGLKGGELNAKTNIGNIIQGGDPAAMASAYAFLGETDPTMGIGLNMWANGATDDQVAIMQNRVGGKTFSSGESLSLQGQAENDIEKLLSDQVMEQFKANLKEPEAPEIPKQFAVDFADTEKSLIGAAQMANPGLDSKAATALLQGLDPETYQLAAQASQEAIRMTGDKALGARAAALAIGGGQMPEYRSGAWNPFVGESLGRAAPGTQQKTVAPTPPQIAIDNLMYNPTPDNIALFRSLFGDEAYAKIAGE